MGIKNYGKKINKKELKNAAQNKYLWTNYNGLYITFLISYTRLYQNFINPLQKKTK